MRTDRAWAVARADGTVVSGELPAPWWPQVPLVRVLAGLARGLWLGVVGARRRGGAGRPRIGPMVRALLAAEATVLVLGWMLAGLRPPAWEHPLLEVGLWVAALGAFRLVAPEVQWRYHGAEHKAVTAYERGVDLADIESVLGCPRVHPRCGTNVIVWLALCAPIVSRLPGTAQLVALLLALAVIAEVLTLSARRPGSPLARLILAPGSAAQRWVTTKEPSAAEQQVGCAALRACLDRHHLAAGDLSQRPFHLGGRFSAKARGPSM
jgi:hypothetical protein